MGAELTVFVADPHAIFRRGVAECLRAIGAITGFSEAATVERAREDPLLAEAHVLIIDPQLTHAEALIRSVSAAGTAVIVCVSGTAEVAPALRAGAVGFVHKATVSPEMLAAGVRAAAAGLAVVSPELVGALAQAPRAAAVNGTRASRPSGPGLTSREQRVLTLLADGHPTREVAARLSYSERTVKNVLHDAVTKLGARSRSEAIAHAVREGLI